jgi:hypothetical protein
VYQKKKSRVSIKKKKPGKPARAEAAAVRAIKKKKLAQVYFTALLSCFTAYKEAFYFTALLRKKEKLA